MIAVDTNILVYAHRKDSPWHYRAGSCIRELAQGRNAWAIPWPCLHEFLAIVTHARIYAPPSPLEIAIEQINSWLESPSLFLLTETGHHWTTLREAVHLARLTGPQIHDARVAALCLDHGVEELWTADRDFGRFGQLRARNPLV